MTRATLDRTRSFAQVYGASSVAFEQDHKLFNHLGLECKEDGTWDHDDKEILSEDEAEPKTDYQAMRVGPLNKLLKQRSGKGMGAGVTKDALIAALMQLDQEDA